MYLAELFDILIVLQMMMCCKNLLSVYPHALMKSLEKSLSLALTEMPNLSVFLPVRYQLMVLCWSFSPQLRPTFSQILNSLYGFDAQTHDPYSPFSQPVYFQNYGEFMFLSKSNNESTSIIFTALLLLL